MPFTTTRRPATLRTQIIAVFGLLVVALALVLALIFGTFMRQHAQQRSASDLHAVARNAAELLAEGLLERSRVVDVLSRSEILWRDGLGSATVVEMLGRSQAMHPNSLWIGVADPDGTVRAATGGLLVGQSVKTRPWFGAGLQGLFVGDVHPAKLLESKLPAPPSGDPLRFLDFAAPIKADGQTLGVLGIHGSWDWARQVIGGLLPPDAHERQLQIFIFDRAGELIYAPGGKTESWRAAGQRVPLEADRGDTTGQVPVPRVVPWLDDGRYLTSSVRLEPRNAASDLGWQVVAREPEGIALAPTRNALRVATGIGCGAALLACCAAWLAARRLSLDLNRVAHAAQRVEQGVTDAAIPLLDSNLEVMTLSTSLHRMTERLVSANAEMEAQVRQRTSELESANRELDQMVRHDPLTGVLNRRGFHAQYDLVVALARRGARPLCLLMVDADHFKRVNDTHGHDVGDDVLRVLARLMTERLRSSDVVARFGGEEFVALLPDTDREAASAVAGALRRAIAAHQHPQAGQVTVSVGVASLQLPDEGLDSLLRRADEALYAAKRQGRDRVVVADEVALV